MSNGDPIERLHYFDHQFLRQADFTDEQEYHIRMRRLHNSRMHTWGVAEGLLLSASVNDTSVTVSPGVAIDSQGREIVLPKAGSADISGVTGAAKRVLITISYAEQQAVPATDPGVTGFTRCIESPLIGVRDAAPADPSLTLVLGTVEVTAGKVTGAPNAQGRRAAGVVAGDLEANTLRARTATLTAGLDVTGNIAVSGSVDGRDVGNDGSRLDAHLSVTNGNPHGTTAQQVGALPVATGGTINAQLVVRTNVPNIGQPTMVATAQPNATAQPTMALAALSAVSALDNAHGLHVRSNSATSATAQPAVRVDGNAVINGNLTVTGSKGNYVVDTFINASGQSLRTGDVVRLKGTPVTRFHGLNNKIPIPEVTLADAEHAGMVIGVVDQEVIQDGLAPDTRVNPDDPTEIVDGGSLLVVTLGSFAHCRADASAGPIEVGDLLTSSPTPGCAQKAVKPRLGTIIGKALEPLAEGSGYIAVFVTSR